MSGETASGGGGTAAVERCGAAATEGGAAPAPAAVGTGAPDAAGERATETCPDCGRPVPVDPRFVTWCAACDWNVDPAGDDDGDTGADPRTDRVERLRRAMAHRYGEQLFDDLVREPVSATGGTPPRHRAAGGPATVLANALALAVHALTSALALLGLWLLIARWGEGAQPYAGGLLLALAFLLRPRFGRPDGPESELPRLERTDAPRFFGLLDEIAGAVGTRGVDVVELDADVNASVVTYGIRQRRVLRLGMPLWAVLTPQEKVALLGHEFGHYAHGDTRHSLLFGSALNSLTTWLYMLVPSAGRSLLDMFTNLLTAIPRWGVYGLILLLDQATLRASQRAEYLADAAAARIAGRDAAVGLMERLLASRSAEAAPYREIVAARTRSGGPARRGTPAGRPEEAADGLWERVAAGVRGVPAHEYERLRRAAERRGHRVDATHPPTHLRIRHLARTGRQEPVVELGPTRATAVEAELATPGRTVARVLLRDGAA
ncbi:M48 family metallopeptidase [Streptomyces roseicoloratus]|uniref:M48 family metallopeptidase n=1 Tax=Streptomyces roseicoloratus TaxID=2508722 RepID=UPI0010098CBF|nr:M48 family metallopeptidase [Streptomyces roseicoloratus]